MRGFLRRVFRGTERLNRDVLLALADPRPGGALLDCGCGDGAFTRELADRIGVAEAHGVEIVDERVRAAEGHGIVVARADLAGRLPYPDARFDAVHANQVIEHMVDPDTFLRELRRVVRPDGYVLLSTNNLASWHNVAALVLGFQPSPMHASTEVVVGNPLDPYRGHRFGSREDSHQRIFAWQGLHDLVRHHGFRVDAYRTAGYYPLPPALARVATAIDRRHGAFLVARLQPA